MRKLTEALGRRAWLTGAVSLACLACKETAGPSGPQAGPPYLAIVTRVEADPGVAVGEGFDFRLTEISGTLGIDTVIRAAPFDTLIVPLPSASYDVRLSGLLPKCQVIQGSSARRIIITEGSNTTIARFSVACKHLLELTTLTSGATGATVDDAYIYRVLNEADLEVLAGIIAGTDTVVVEDLPPGEYVMELDQVASNCLTTNQGGRRLPFVVDSLGGLDLEFQITCNNPPAAPTLHDLAANYQDGTLAVVAEVRDPDANIHVYHWDVTDCNGFSIRGGPGSRRGLGGGRAERQDSMAIVAGFHVSVPAGDVQSACAAFRVVDLFGNTTAWREVPLGAMGGIPPTVSGFDARIVGNRLEVLINAADPDGQFIGLFPMLRMPDGTFGARDGKIDIGIWDAVGFVESRIPPVPLTGGVITVDDVLGVEVLVIDAQGHLIRLYDDRIL